MEKILSQHQDSNPRPSDSDRQAWALAILTAFRVFLTNHGPQTGSHWPLEGRPVRAVAGNHPKLKQEFIQSVYILMSRRPTAELTSSRYRARLVLYCKLEGRSRSATAQSVEGPSK